MSRPLPFYSMLTLSILALAACGENEIPTQPEIAGEPAPATLSLAAAPNTWTARAPLPAGRFWVSAGVALNSAGQSIVYALGGEDMQDDPSFGGPVRAYNVARNTWTTKTSRVSVSRTNGVGKIGGKLYFSGGYLGSGYTAALYAYDYSTDRMIRKADMPKPSGQGVTGVINGKLYVLPGVFEEGPTRRLYRYDPATNVWIGRVSSPHFHRGGAGGVIDGKFNVVGGLNRFQPVADLDVYDPATNTWKTLAPIPTGGRAIGAVLGGKLYVIASSFNPQDARPGSELRAYVYNPATNLWKPRAAPTWTHGTAVRVTLDGKSHLLAVGDSHGLLNETPNDSELYTP
jgi:hypothetical protein